MLDAEHAYRDVLARLERLRPCRRPLTWSARCPAHEDRTPSLLVWVGRTGCLCARCLANRGCTWPEICQALGTDPRAWFPPREDGRRTMSRIAAVYPYQGEDGKLLYQAVRFEPKAFRQRRPDGRGGWLWTVEGVEKVPYRLPELLARPDDPVCVTEGEKDADALRALGLLATTNVGGAGKWRREYGAWLAGRRCVVFCDNDEAGVRHVEAVAGNLVCWGAASLRVVSLPDVPPGGDVGDWLARLPVDGAVRRRELCRLVRAVPEWRATT